MIASHAALTLRLNLRNRLAMIYGFAFPLVFLAAFIALYRHEPIALHMSELLTVTILGGACFGLPTALVAERERGVWRRYRLTATPTWKFIAAVLLARLALILAAGLLQLAVAFAIGMPPPSDPGGLVLAFVVASFAFMALGLMIAMLADGVPAVQALGQCIFLPMLIVGGVAVPLASLPVWAQHLAAFFPGRYAVAALQSSITGAGLGTAWFPMGALLAIGLAAGIAAARMFRWDTAAHARRRGDAGWVLLALTMWIAVGLVAEQGGEVVAPVAEREAVPPATAFIRPARPAPPPPLTRPPPLAAPAAPRPATRTKGWRDVTAADLSRVAFDRLPADSGIVAPIARFDEAPDPSGQDLLDRISVNLPNWSPGQVGDPEQRVRNLLCVAAVPDLLRMESVERFVPVIVFARIRTGQSREELMRILYAIATRPDGGDDAACRELAVLGLPAVTDNAALIRPRIMLYALKLLGRLTGDIVQN